MSNDDRFFFILGGTIPLRGNCGPLREVIFIRPGDFVLPLFSLSPHPNSPSSGQLMFPPSGAAILHQPAPIAVMVFKHSLIIGLIEVSCVHWVHV